MGAKKFNFFHLIKAGVMTGTNVITSASQHLQNFDNEGLEITWTGTPSGTIQILGSVSGVTFYPLTFSPLLSQPGGSAGGYLINLNQFPWPYLQVQYTNATGVGVLDVYISSKDLN